MKVYWKTPVIELTNGEEDTFIELLTLFIDDFIGSQHKKEVKFAENLLGKLKPDRMTRVLSDDTRTKERA